MAHLLPHRSPPALYEPLSRYTLAYGMRFLRSSLFVVGAAAATASEDPTTTTQAPACTATSSSGSGAFFDLRPDMAVVPEKGKSHPYAVTKDYHARGYDYGRNFTLNICGSVVDEVSDVVGVDAKQWANISAYYVEDGKVYSMGFVRQAPWSWWSRKANRIADQNP